MICFSRYRDDVYLVGSGHMSQMQRHGLQETTNQKIQRPQFVDLSQYARF